MEIQHPRIKDGWFTEVSDAHFPGQGFSLRVERILHHSQSDFQDILVFKSTDFGNVLVLDGIIQCTERDEFAYQEMIAHIPLYSHQDPKKVLVIGGGDGGVVREAVKHSCVDSVTLVEIDRTVIELSKKYLPNMSCSINNPKVDLKFCDGFHFLREIGKLDLEVKYDVIITDSSDPDGPAEAFFQEEYFQLLSSALKEDGIVIMQASESVWLDISYLSGLLDTARAVFSNTGYCYTTVPTYTSGQLGLIICSKNKSLALNCAHRLPTNEEQGMMKYYNPQIHRASFVLPTWAESILNKR